MYEAYLTQLLKKSGLKFLGLDGGYVFVRNKQGKVYPIKEERLPWKRF